jgi:hypothetical protein
MAIDAGICETITESVNASIDSHSLEPRMQSRGREATTESTNASIDSHSLESLMQSRGSETITESANARLVMLVLFFDA